MKLHGIAANEIDCCGNSAVMGKDFADISRVRLLNCELKLTSQFIALLR